MIGVANMFMSCSNRRGFTLIELLVVIAIIAILITLLTPVITRSIDRARMTGCISNMKQLASAINMYAADNKGQMPHPCWSSYRNLKNVPDGWLYSGDFSSETAYFESWTNLMTGVLWPYIEDPDVCRCPSDPRPEIEDLLPPKGAYPNDVRLLSTYGFNGSITGYPRRREIPRAMPLKVSDFKPTDIMIWEQRYVDDNGKTHVNDGANYPWEGMHNRHYGKGAVGCVNGAVYVMTKDEFGELVNYGGRNQLWNNPISDNEDGRHGVRLMQ